MGMLKCPICGNEQDETYRPFCSKRCADIDLNRWFKGVYAIPVVGGEEDELDSAISDADNRDTKHENE